MFIVDCETDVKDTSNASARQKQYVNIPQSQLFRCCGIMSLLNGCAVQVAHCACVVAVVWPISVVIHRQRAIRSTVY
jgi:hypothetical protein